MHTQKRRKTVNMNRREKIPGNPPAGSDATVRLPRSSTENGERKHSVRKEEKEKKKKENAEEMNVFMGALPGSSTKKFFGHPKKDRKTEEDAEETFCYRPCQSFGHPKTDPDSASSSICCDKGKTEENADRRPRQWIFTGHPDCQGMYIRNPGNRYSCICCANGRPVNRGRVVMREMFGSHPYNPYNASSSSTTSSSLSRDGGKTDKSSHGTSKPVSSSKKKKANDTGKMSRADPEPAAGMSGSQCDSSDRDPYSI